MPCSTTAAFERHTFNDSGGWSFPRSQCSSLLALQPPIVNGRIWAGTPWHASCSPALASSIFQFDIAELDVPCSAKSGSECCGGTRGRHRPSLHESAQDTQVRAYNGAGNSLPTLSRRKMKTTMFLLLFWVSRQLESFAPISLAPPAQAASFYRSPPPFHVITHFARPASRRW
jgi:hypothetical protein